MIFDSNRIVAYHTGFHFISEIYLFEEKFSGWIAMNKHTIFYSQYGWFYDSYLVFLTSSNNINFYDNARLYLPNNFITYTSFEIFQESNLTFSDHTLSEEKVDVSDLTSDVYLDADFIIRYPIYYDLSPAFSEGLMLDKYELSVNYSKSSDSPTKMKFRLESDYDIRLKSHKESQFTFDRMPEANYVDPLESEYTSFILVQELSIGGSTLEARKPLHVIRNQ